MSSDQTQNQTQDSPETTHLKMVISTLQSQRNELSDQTCNLTVTVKKYEIIVKDYKEELVTKDTAIGVFQQDTAAKEQEIGRLKLEMQKYEERISRLQSDLDSFSANAEDRVVDVLDGDFQVQDSRPEEENSTPAYEVEESVVKYAH